MRRVSTGSFDRMTSTSRHDRPLRRLPLLALAMLALLAALWGGLQRFGWALPVIRPSLAMAHGPLMVCGFLGTLISLERAVALRRLWAYLAPLLTGVGGLLLVCGGHGALGPLLITAGSVVLVAAFLYLLRRQAEPFLQVMTAGAAAWLIGNAVWLAGAAIPQVVHWWLGFLVLTIAGERLELSRMLRHEARVERQFLYVAAALALALGATSVFPGSGVRLTGLALLVLAAWLVRYDVARYTIRSWGLTRFAAACLLSGYAWLFTGGVLMAAYGARTAGPVYDAYLHAVFVGFVFAMIFGHAPIIFPSILGLPITYRPYFYFPLVLLHVSLLARVVGDVGGDLVLRRWGGMGSGAAILLYLLGILYTVLTSRAQALPDLSLPPDGGAYEGEAPQPPVADLFR